MGAQQRAESQIFGEVAEGYHASRLGYPDELISDILDYAKPAGRPVVEVGAGTGKATVSFAARGLGLTCVEPDARMAEVLRRTVAGHPSVRVEVCTFEEWQPGGRRFGLLYAATSWHWTDPERRWDLAHAALAPGGAIALFWNGTTVVDPALHAALAEVDTGGHDLRPPHTVLASELDPEDGGERWTEAKGWPQAQCRRDGRFTDLLSTRHLRPQHYSTAHYLGYLDSISRYRVLPDELREQVLRRTGEVLDAHGGGIDMVAVTDAFRARAI
ncbi:class I SAM-dependent methyltransferase [Streptacidiphilus sp. PB12-B1b]|uniref:class I SAM-dependent methyltransferase n=1 Tax=Streptacidiphilus sp. PB12-B1b TaxID=2705012 RepID=UPI0015F7E0C9|nr:class I SAM-dependent methyltransferase [Streptacidiphilus sp. PB12-B1b]QMU76439.1 class I SAM-dependent methyltransferase [Streptacidiphilus sp. PB12-B1b]